MLLNFITDECIKSARRDATVFVVSEDSRTLLANDGGRGYDESCSIVTKRFHDVRMPTKQTHEA